MTFRTRRARNLILLIILAAILCAGLWFYSLRLRQGTFISGWILAAFVIFLALYNVRKQFAYFPLLKSSAWLQLHIYVGLLSMVLFTLHACFQFGHRWHLPSGPLNILLAALYILTAFSGIFGLLMTRSFPSRITDRGEEVIFERIPIFLRHLRDRSAELIVEAVSDSNASTLPDFYSQRLVWFFARPRHYWPHLFNSRRPLLVLETELASLNRYLNDREKDIAVEISALIEKKDLLDHAWALQGTLKGWLFIHIAMTYSLLAFMAVHILIAYAFSGGVR